MASFRYITTGTDVRHESFVWNDKHIRVLLFELYRRIKVDRGNSVFGVLMERGCRGQGTYWVGLYIGAVETDIWFEAWEKETAGLELI